MSSYQERRKEEEKRRREQQNHLRNEQQKKRQDALREQKKKMRLKMQQLKKQQALLRKQKRSQVIAKDGGVLGRMMRAFFRKFKGPARSGEPMSAEDKSRQSIDAEKKALTSQMFSAQNPSTLTSSFSKEDSQKENISKPEDRM